jgi:hypothetical protein
MAGSCEHASETSVSIKGWEFLDHLNDYWLLKKDSGSWC